MPLFHACKVGSQPENTLVCVCCASSMLLAGPQQEDTHTRRCAWTGTLGTLVLPQQPALMCSHTVVEPQSQLDELKA